MEKNTQSLTPWLRMVIHFQWLFSSDMKHKTAIDSLIEDLHKQSSFGSSILTSLMPKHSNSHFRGAPYDDFPESGWDKLMALNVKSIFYSKPLIYYQTTIKIPAYHL